MDKALNKIENKNFKDFSPKIIKKVQEMMKKTEHKKKEDCRKFAKFKFINNQTLNLLKKMEESKRWLKQAIKDLESAKVSKDNKHYEWACFQSQQSAEKALKGFLYSKGFRAILTHSIRDLILESEKHEKGGFKNLLEEGKFLDSFYISTRYPNGLVGESIPADYYSKEDAEKCINYAELILREVKKFLKS